MGARHYTLRRLDGLSPSKKQKREEEQCSGRCIISKVEMHESARVAT